MAMRIAVVVAVLTSLSYFHTIRILKEQELNKLEKYVVERGQRERAIFTMAEDNQAVLKKEFLRQLEILGDSDPQEEFDRLAFRDKDGSIRKRNFDKAATYFEPSVWVNKNTPVDARVRRLLTLYHKLVSAYGPAWQTRFVDTYIQSGENYSSLFFPGTTWAADTPADFDWTKEEYWWTADEKHDPEKKTVWTGLYYDAMAKQWMVSCLTPVYGKDNRIDGMIGNDVLLNELFNRTILDHLKDTYNILLRGDGRLIMHASWLQKIQEKQGVLTVQESGDPHLKSIYEMVQGAKPDQHILENKKYKEYLAVYNIPETNWYFIIVYPQFIITRLAFRSAIFILILGVLSLIAEVSILYLVLRGKIAIPLKSFIQATDEVASGKLDIKLDDRRNDELGRLAISFKSMAKDITQRDKQLKEHAVNLEKEVEAKTASLKTELQERKKMEKVLLESEKMAAVGQLAAGVAHEINNPLGVILGFSQSIVKHIKTGDALEMPLKSIEREAVRCKELVQNLLTFSRTGQAEREEANLNQLIESSLSLVMAQSKIKNVELVKDLSSNIPKLLSNKNQIQQMMMNLINNALDAMPKGGKLTLRSKKSRLNNQDAVEIQVEDTGVGIPKEIQTKIFEPFFTTKEVGQGTGLGLSLVYEIVQKHQGQIKVDSQTGKGTVFTIVLPVHFG